jgi:hypothetical protein
MTEVSGHSRNVSPKYGTWVMSREFVGGIYIFVKCLQPWLKVFIFAQVLTVLSRNYPVFFRAVGLWQCHISLTWTAYPPWLYSQ